MARKKQSQRQRQRQSQRQTVIVKVGGEDKPKRRARRRRAPRRSGGGGGGGDFPPMMPIQMPVVAYQTGYGSFPLIQGSSAPPPPPDSFPYRTKVDVQRPLLEDVGVGTHGFAEVPSPPGTEEVFRPSGKSQELFRESSERAKMMSEDIDSLLMQSVLPSKPLEVEKPFVPVSARASSGERRPEVYEPTAREGIERMDMLFEDMSSEMNRMMEPFQPSAPSREPIRIAPVQSDEPFGGVPPEPVIKVEPFQFRPRAPPAEPERVVSVRRPRQSVPNIPSKADLVMEYKRVFGRNPPTRLTKMQIYLQIIARLESKKLS